MPQLDDEVLVPWLPGATDHPSEHRFELLGGGPRLPRLVGGVVSRHGSSHVTQLNEQLTGIHNPRLELGVVVDESVSPMSSDIGRVKIHEIAWPTIGERVFEIAN